MSIITNPITGNVLGSLSLFVGIWGIILTYKTMKAAKRIEENINQQKAEAINKLNFNSFRIHTIKKWNRKKKAISKDDLISKNLCNDFLSSLNELKGYKSILPKEDIKIIEDTYERAKDISMEKKRNKNESVIEFIELISNIINILKKGEYDL